VAVFCGVLCRPRGFVMTSTAREYFTVDLRGLRPALAARAQRDDLTESDVLRSALAAALREGDASPMLAVDLLDLSPAIRRVKLSVRVSPLAAPVLAPERMLERHHCAPDKRCNAGTMSIRLADITPSGKMVSWWLEPMLMSRRTNLGVSMFSAATTALWLCACWASVRGGAFSRDLLAAECVWYLGALASITVLALPLSTLSRSFGFLSPHVQAPAIFVALGLPALLLVFQPKAVSVAGASLSLSIPLLLCAALGVWLCWPGHAPRGGAEA
jgi:hypothetical protein